MLIYYIFICFRFLPPLRLKLWEFIGNGGRVGFAYYSASTWKGHETSKKDGLLVATASSSQGLNSNSVKTAADDDLSKASSLDVSARNLLHLFRQVQAVRVTAMSCRK
jgi:hypothetical protein